MPKKLEGHDALLRLGECVLWALKYLDTRSGTGVMANFKTGVVKTWQQDFEDALVETGLAERIEKKKSVSKKKKVQ